MKEYIKLLEAENMWKLSIALSFSEKQVVLADISPIAVYLGGWH